MNPMTSLYNVVMLAEIVAGYVLLYIFLNRGLPVFFIVVYPIDIKIIEYQKMRKFFSDFGKEFS